MATGMESVSDDGPKEDPPKTDFPPDQRFVGVCKWFNVKKGFGFVNADGQTSDIFVHQSVLKMEGFRSLGEGERVAFFIKQREGKPGLWEAWDVTAEDEGSQIRGSSHHPLGGTAKKDDQIRCFKCGKYGNHTAVKCRRIPGSERVCYYCRRPGHVLGDCPSKAAGRSANKGGAPMREFNTEDPKQMSFETPPASNPYVTEA